MNTIEGYIPQANRKKILLICDDIRAFSGVSTVAKEIVLNTAHHYNWVNIAGSINHPDKGKRFDVSHETNTLLNIDDSSVFLYPVDGYGDTTFLRSIIQLEKPDAIFLITDPRYFAHIFSIENEIRKKIPIIYLNIWDSPFPYPLWNKPFYESCDALLAISKQTKNINEVVLGEKIQSKIIEYVPHGLNQDIYFPIGKDHAKYNDLLNFKKKVLNGKEYDFVLYFNSRNIRRKQIPDAMIAFRMFLDNLPKEKADKCAFILHTELLSEHGTNLLAVRDYFFKEYPNTIIFHTDILGLEEMNYLYNSTDAQILLTDNEGWGLSLTEALLVGNPIIANVQGGMQDQMRFEDENGNWIDFDLNFPSNHRGTYKKHGEWAFPVYPSNISIQGSIPTPYISSDRCNIEDAMTQIYTVYSLSPDKRKELGLKGREFAINEGGFTSKRQADRVIEAVDKLFNTWKPREKYELINATTHEIDNSRQHKLIY
jgi:hypothetical protein